MFTAYQAEGIRPLVANSPLMSQSTVVMAARFSARGDRDRYRGSSPGRYGRDELGRGSSGLRRGCPDDAELPGHHAGLGAEPGRVPGSVRHAWTVLARRRRAAGALSSAGEAPEAAAGALVAATTGRAVHNDQDEGKLTGVYRSHLRRVAHKHCWRRRRCCRTCRREASIGCHSTTKENTLPRTHRLRRTRDGRVGLLVRSWPIPQGDKNMTNTTAVRKEAAYHGVLAEDDYGYAQVIKIGNTIHVSGQLSQDDKGLKDVPARSMTAGGKPADFSMMAEQMRVTMPTLQRSWAHLGSHPRPRSEEMPMSSMSMRRLQSRQKGALALRQVLQPQWPAI